MGRWIVRPLTITRSNLVVVLQGNVVLLAKRDEYHGNTDSLLTLAGVDNVSLVGQPGSRLEMRRADYAVPSWVGHRAMLETPMCSCKPLSAHCAQGGCYHCDDCFRSDNCYRMLPNAPTAHPRYHGAHHND